MTEELEKEARKYLKKTFHHEYYDDVVMVMGFAEPREKRIAELEAQIEKIKCCNICKHYQWESCNYHSLSEKDCKANNHSLFELVGDKRK